MEGLTRSSEFVEGYIHGLNAVKDMLDDPNILVINENMKASFVYMRQLLDTQISLIDQLKESFGGGEIIFLPNEKDRDF